MKNKIYKKIIAAVAALGMVAALTACGNTTAPDSSTAGGENDSKVYTVGVIQAIEHDSLKETYDGFRQALADNGYEEGVDIVYDYQNAQGDTSNLSTIADRFVSKEVDLILSITTDATQTVANKTTEIPILATAVTSYTESGILEDESAPGGNVSGTSDMNPVAAQIELIKDLVPEVKTIGLIYNSSEVNSTVQIKMAKEKIEELGLEWAEVTVTNGGDVAQAMQSLVTKCEAIYIPTDNVVANSMATVHSVAMESKTPTVCGAQSMVKDGGLATMGISYYEIGYKTGLMAIEVMNGKNVGDMPVQYADKSDEITINGTVAEEIGYEIPEKYLSYVTE